MANKEVIITAPSLDPAQNVSGVSSVVSFIIQNNGSRQYVHFELGRKDKEKGGVFRIGALLKAYKKWGGVLKEHPDAIVHYSFPLSAMSILRDPLFMRKARRTGHKMVVHVHGGIYLTSLHIPFLLKRVLRHVFSWDVPFIVLSEKEKSTLAERFGAKRVDVLPNCVDLQGASAFTRERKPDDEPLVIGYLGRIEPNKGMTELLFACQKLRKEKIPFRLELAGKEEHDDEYLPFFDRELGRDFRYAGIVSGKAKEDFLKDLDILVFPSYFEGLPMSLLECMSYSVVPVTTPVGSIPEVVKDGENGVFIKVKDDDSIVQAVKRLHSKRGDLFNMGIRAQETIFANFSPEKYIARLNQLYDAL